MELADLLDSVPDYREFPFLEELERNSRQLLDEFPNLVRAERLGCSAEGRPIELLAIGEGRKRALFLGAPHPSEPVGTLTLEFLSRLLCEREDLRRRADLTWLIVKVADPDGFVRNEGWLKAPGSLRRYALHYYCPPPREQVEWGFPIDYKTLRFATPPPETRAVMAAIDRYRPDFLFPLHNAAFGGVYFYASERRERLFRELREWTGRLGLPLHRGEPELPFVEAWDTAVFRTFGARELYEFFARGGEEDPGRTLGTGTSSIDHLTAKVPGAFALVSEVPQFTAAAAADASPAGVSRREALRIGSERSERIWRTVARHFEALRDLLPDDRLSRAVADSVARAAGRLAAHRLALRAPQYDREATRAEFFDVAVCRCVYAARALGMLSRAAARVGESGRAEELRRELEAVIARVEAESRPVMLPLRSLVALQAGACLLAVPGAA